MPHLSQPIAIQSWCFRAFKTLDVFLPELTRAGAMATELCGVHADFADPDSALAVAEQCKAAGVSIVAIGVEQMTGDDAHDRGRFAWCRSAGVRNMSVTFPTAALDHDLAGFRAAERLADEYGVQLGIHNHGGYDWLGNPPILAYVFGKVGRQIGLHLDTAWAIDAKQNPVEMADRFADRLVGCHVKDFTYSPDRQPTDVIIGNGSLDLPRFADVLKRTGFAGPLVIEYEGDEAAPVPALSECVAKLRAVV